MKENFELPNNWCVRGIADIKHGYLKHTNSTLYNLMKKTFPKMAEDLGFTKNYFYFEDVNGSLAYVPICSGIEITFEQFVNYVLNKPEFIEKTPEDYSYLIPLLKKLNIK